jgi:hypothetical protein
LHRCGLDHEQLSNRGSGRDFRLVEVNENVVQGVFA